MKKQLDNVVRKMLDDVEFAEVKDFPEFIDLDFSIDLMEPGRLATEVSLTMLCAAWKPHHLAIE